MKRIKLVILPRLYDASGQMDEPWFVFYSYRNPKTGKMHRFKVSRGFKFLSKKERYAHGQKLVEELTQKLKAGWNPFDDEQVIYDDYLQYANVLKVYGKQRKSNLTVNFFLSDFLEHTKKRVCPKSFESYQSKIRLFSQWLHTKGLAENDVSSVTGDVILEFIDYLVDERGLQGRTVQKYGVNLRQFFTYLVDKKKIFENPMPTMPQIPNTVDMAARPIRQGDVAKLKREIEQRDPQLWLACQFQFYCYIRPGNELRNMRINWIDFEAGTVTIPAFEQTENGSEGRAKNRTTQTIVIPRQFLRDLIEKYYLNKYNGDFYVLGRDRMPGHIRIGKNTMTNRFNQFRDKLGLSKDYKFYSWKHTGGLSASSNGIPVKDIQLQMRHSSLDVTDKYLRKMRGVDSEHLKNNYPSL